MYLIIRNNNYIAIEMVRSVDVVLVNM